MKLRKTPPFSFNRKKEGEGAGTKHIDEIELQMATPVKSDQRRVLVLFSLLIEQSAVLFRHFRRLRTFKKWMMMNLLVHHLPPASPLNTSSQDARCVSTTSQDFVQAQPLSENHA
jgi:hypothetical protein